MEKLHPYNEKVSICMKKIISILLVSIILLASCGTSTTQSKAGVLRLASDSDFSTLHPHKTSSGVDFQNTGQYLQTLVAYDENGKLSPGASKSWSVSEDGLVHTFLLQENGKWSNGDPVTAGDFVFAWQTLATDKEASYSSFVSYMKNGPAVIKGELPATELGAKAISDLELQITLEQPLAYFVDILAFPTMAPLNEKFYKTVGDDYGKTAANTVANGPFMVETFTPDTEIIFKKNPNYWDAQSVSLNTVNMRIVKDSATQSVLYDGNELDSILMDGELNTKYAGDPGLDSGISPSIIYFYLSGTTGVENKVLSNKKFRQAISYAIDKTVITESILKNGSKPLDTLIPDNFGDFDGKTFREISTTHQDLKFNVATATQLLEEAKAELGDTPLTFDLNFPDSALFKSVYENVKSQLETNLPGVTINLISQPSNIYYQQVMEKNTPAGHGQWGVDYADVESFFTVFKSTSKYNYGNFQNDTYEAAYNLAESNELALAPLERAKAYIPAEETLLDEAVFIPLYQRATKWIAKDNVKGITLSPVMPGRQYRFISVD